MAERDVFLVSINVSHPDRSEKAERSSAVGHTFVSGSRRGGSRRSPAPTGAASGRQPIPSQAGRTTAAARTCKVVDHGRDFVVTNVGGHMVIQSEGTTVWTGVRSAGGQYETTSTTLTPQHVVSLLEVVSVAELVQGNGASSGSRRRPPAPSSTTPTSKQAPVKPKRGRRKKDKLSDAQREALSAGRQVRAEQVASRRADPIASQRPAASVKPRAKRAPKPKAAPASTAAASTAAAVKQVASAKTKSAETKTKPKGSQSTPAPPASATSRRAGTEPVPPVPRTQRSIRPADLRPAGIDDTAVLAEMKDKLLKVDPVGGAALFDVCRRVWLAGGREATLAWMASRNIRGVVEAFDDWMTKNQEAARALLEKKPASQHRGVA